MVLESITGTVSDQFWKETKKALGYVPSGISRLCINFDRAAINDSSLILSVSIPNSLRDAKLLSPGDRVLCSIRPAPVGYASQLLSLSRLK